MPSPPACNLASWCPGEPPILNRRNRRGLKTRLRRPKITSYKVLKRLIGLIFHEFLKRIFCLQFFLPSRLCRAPSGVPFFSWQKRGFFVETICQALGSADFRNPKNIQHIQPKHLISWFSQANQRQSTNLKSSNGKAVFLRLYAISVLLDYPLHPKRQETARSRKQK